MQQTPPQTDFIDLLPSNVNWALLLKKSKSLIKLPHF